MFYKKLVKLALISLIPLSSLFRYPSSFLSDHSDPIIFFLSAFTAYNRQQTTILTSVSGVLVSVVLRVGPLITLKFSRECKTDCSDSKNRRQCKTECSDSKNRRQWKTNCSDSKNRMQWKTDCSDSKNRRQWKTDCSDSKNRRQWKTDCSDSKNRMQWKTDCSDSKTIATHIKFLTHLKMKNYLLVICT